MLVFWYGASIANSRAEAKLFVQRWRIQSRFVGVINSLWVTLWHKDSFYPSIFEYYELGHVGSVSKRSV